MHVLSNHSHIFIEYIITFLHHYITGLPLQDTSAEEYNVYVTLRKKYTANLQGRGSQNDVRIGPIHMWEDHIAEV